MSFAQNNNSDVYVIIKNIPKIYLSYDLRNFFSSFVESGGFICFHYCHRPDVQTPSNSSYGDKKKKCASMFCIVKVVADRVHELIEIYNGHHWFDTNGETFPTCCFIKGVKLSDNDISDYKGDRWAKPRNLHSDYEEVYIQDVEYLLEMRPPFFMPNGNVGTTTNHILNEIHMYRLPLRGIRKLLRQIPRSQAMRIYSNVREFYRNCKKDRSKLKKIKKHCHLQLPSECLYWEDGGYKEILYQEDEEWDRCEVLHDYVYAQESNRKRPLFEWEKGVSSLGFCKDALYWDAMERNFNARALDNCSIDACIMHEEPDDRWAIPRNLSPVYEELCVQDAEFLPEMHPLSLMPSGNVGTTKDRILKEIPTSRLPPQVIYKLNEQFPKSQTRGIDSGVAFNSMSKEDDWKMKRNIFNSNQFLGPPFQNRYSYSHLPGECSYWGDGRGYKEILHQQAEKLDPYKALHDYVYAQERPFQEIFEYQNGGSMLGFCKDAQYWDTMERHLGGKNLDVCKIDTRLYKEQDNDTRDLVRMKLVERYRNGRSRSQSTAEVVTQTKVDQRYEFAGFEKYNKGIGTKILESFGWKKGQGIGKNASGIAEPLPNEGQHSLNKKGLGYHVTDSVKLDDHPLPKICNIDTPIHEKPVVENIRDLAEKKLEKKHRNGSRSRSKAQVAQTEVDLRNEFAGFEKYNKGIGTKILESFGWKKGQGIGKNATGIAEPLPNDGKRPSNKKGFGYCAEKLDGPPPRKKRKHRHPDFENRDNAVFISTLYDDAHVSDTPESVLASSHVKLKYQKEFLKETM